MWKTDDLGKDDKDCLFGLLLYTNKAAVHQDLAVKKLSGIKGKRKL